MSRTADGHRDGRFDFYAELPEQVVYLLYQVYHRREVRVREALAEIGLPLMTWRMILALQRLQPCSMNTLARLSNWERTAVTRNLDQMVAQGLAVRETPPEDRRQVLVSLTEAGMEYFERGRLIVTRLNRESLAGLSAERLEILRDCLDTHLHSLIPDPELAEDIIKFQSRQGVVGEDSKASHTSALR